MKMHIESRKHLGVLNESRFFCECQMASRSTPHQCTLSPTKRSWLERLFPDRYFSTQVIVASIVVIGIIVFAFNQWN